MSESLREQLEANLDKISTRPTEAEAAHGEKSPASTETTPAKATEPELKPGAGRTLGRPRDEGGRLLPGKADQVAKASAAEPAKSPPADSSQKAAPATGEESKPRPKYPSTWKKDFEQHWNKLDPALLEEITRRENDFARGVSAYKAEYDRAKPVLDALAPHAELFKQYGIDPAQQIGKYIEVHKGLALGTPEQKLALFLRMAQDYQVPLQQLFVKDKDGQVFFNPQIQAMPPQQQAREPDVRRTVQDILMQERAQLSLAEFEQQKDEHTHYERVRETMAQLLDAGLADDLQSAYEAALRHPRHADLFEAEQKIAREKDESRKREEAKAQAAKARAAAVSPKSQTPAGGAGGGAKGLRAALEENFDSIVSGRV